jgi:Putative bacterial sensory transduction regulator
MFWKTTALVACAVLAMGAARKPAPVTAAPAAAPAAAKPVAAATPEAPFDARDPSSLIALLATAGAKATLAHREDDAVLLTVTSTAADFSAQYAGCNAQGRACKAVLFDNMTDKPGPTFAQLNAFNQTSAMCRSYEDRAAKPHVIYSTLLFEDDSRDRMKIQVAAWTGCIAEFRNFLKDPNEYLANAP